MTRRAFGSEYLERLEGWVAGCRVRLALDTTRARWEESLTGTLFLTGGPDTQNFQIGVGLAVYAGESSDQLLLPYQRSTLDVGPGESRRVDFELQVPWGTPLRNLQVRAVVRSGWRRRTVLSASVEILPPAGFQRLAAVVEEVAESRVTGWRMVEPEGALRVQFVPGKTNSKPYEALGLECYRNEGMIHGTLTIDLVTHTFTDRLCRVLGVDRVGIPFRFPENDPSGGRSFFAQAWPRHLEHYDLPIPATPPTPSVIDLPLPSEAVAPDQLA
jgi:hypothetical protein